MKTVASLSAKGTSEKILQAAKWLFAQYGYHGVSVKKITEEAGANCALVSYHFGGKAQLYRKVLEQQAEKLLRLAELLKEPGQTPLACILAFLDEVKNVFLKEPESIHVIYREFLTPTAVGNNIVRQQMIAFYDRLTEAFDRAKDSQYVKAETDSRRTAFVLISIFAFYLVTYSYEAISESKRLPGADDSEKLRSVYLDYLNTISTGKDRLQ
ncbi:MAG: TetR/AcrR family transcriptional regulator [Acidaminococcaceae bacterium]|nr:TetR/AcrR family transcriptional regulator [Acidaminococcaceae bacterium]